MPLLFIEQIRGRGKCRGPRKSRSHSVPGAIQFSKVTRKRKLWTDESMSKAIEAVRQGASILQAAITHEVPCQTLQDQISGIVTYGYNPRPKPYLSQTEEKDLVDFLIETLQAINNLPYPEHEDELNYISKYLVQYNHYNSTIINKKELCSY